VIVLRSYLARDDRAMLQPLLKRRMSEMNMVWYIVERVTKAISKYLA